MFVVSFVFFFKRKKQTKAYIQEGLKKEPFRDTPAGNVANGVSTLPGACAKSVGRMLIHAWGRHAEATVPKIACTKPLPKIAI